MTGATAVLAIVVSLLSITASISVGIRALIRRIQKSARRDKEFEDLRTSVQELETTAGRMRSEIAALQTRLAQMEAPRNGVLNELDSVQHGLERLRRDLEGIRADAGAAEPRLREALRRLAVLEPVRALPGRS